MVHRTNVVVFFNVFLIKGLEMQEKVQAYYSSFEKEMLVAIGALLFHLEM